FRRNGVSTYLALTFGTLLSSQGTDASFVLTLSGFPPDVSFGIRFIRYCVFPTLPDHFRAVSGVELNSGGRLEGLAFRRVHYFSGFSR
ncbi:hypothetical protein, partial [Streptomyces sp. NPDC051561]|uniref:hypothetical protein n=1 Tax=Streptomyces sp. NPDC051561 TaxID=3365658 RepID=UPI00379A862D